DILGSSRRPPYLLEARQKGVPAAELARLEDRAITEVVRMQEAAGLPIVSDGEYRRKLFFSTVVATAHGFDPEGFERSHRDEQGSVVRFGVPTPVARLTRKASLVDLEYRFTRSLTERPIKVTMPSPSLMLSYWKEGVSDRAYPSKDAFLDDLVRLMNEDARALAAAGAAYLQIDAPQYTYITDRAVRPDIADPLGTLRKMVAADNRVFEGVTGALTGLHLCRGNYRSRFTGTKPYDEYAETVFAGARVSRLLLEYDDYRSGDFGPLRFVPPGVTVVLGLVTTKRSELEREDELVRRIDAAARVVPLERLALSTQCGFASTFEGNEITPDAQRAKLELIVRTAERVWGHA
ncbi:MAG TPA: methionine synthase, partial [Candidatus Rokubacteria bacterium]|nr:methionine synthase [Candidatus Rokubacteria bacterium]